MEKYYSTGIFTWISSFQRILFGWLPFSFGDLLYGVAAVWLTLQLIKLIKNIRHGKAGRQYARRVASRIFGYSLLVYITFNAFWGLNYNRRGIAYQLKMEIPVYSKEELVNVAELLAVKLNTLRPYSLAGRPVLSRNKNLFREAISSYRHLSGANDIFKYPFPSAKPSIYSYLGNYLGFTGYYNPFTGEAQTNTTIPVFARPFTACHEIGHQLGYAKESEANFAGYLSASGSSDSAFRYSTYFEMYAYASRYLYAADSMELKRINKSLSPDVKKDFAELRKFFLRYSTPLEAIIDRLYARFLVANEQPSGKMSYNEVVALLIAHYRKSGTI